MSNEKSNKKEVGHIKIPNLENFEIKWVELLANDAGMSKEEFSGHIIKKYLSDDIMPPEIEALMKTD